MKISRRLGVSPGPVALNGPVIVNVWMCGRPVQSKVSAELRRNGCSRTVSCDRQDPRRTPPSPSCGPAFTGTRTRSRASIASPVSVGLSNSAARSVVAADRRQRSTRSPSTAISTSCGYSRPRTMFEVGAKQLHLEDVLAVERERVADARCRRPCRAAALRCAGPATDPGGRGRCRCRRAMSGSPTASALIFVGRRRDSAPAATATRRARRRCCRSRTPNRPAAAATRRRRRARAGRGSRWRTRRGSAGAGAARRDSDARPPADRARLSSAACRAFVRRLVGPARALRRHRPRLQLPDDLFPDLGERGLRDIELSSDSPAVFSRWLWQATQ